jgi:hypothetical protein
MKMKITDHYYALNTTDNDLIYKNYEKLSPNNYPNTKLHHLPGLLTIGISATE